MSQSVLKLDEDILKKVQSHVPENSSPFQQGGEEEEYRFTTFLLDYFQKRKAVSTLPASGISYFVYIPPQLARKVENLGSSVLSLRRDKSRDLSGKIFLCLDSALNKNRVLSFENSDNQRDLLEEKFQEIKELLGDFELLNAVVDFNIRSMSIFLTESPVDPTSEYEILIDIGRSQEQFSREKLTSFSYDFHETETKLPGCGLMIWKVQGDYTLTDHAEDRIARRFTFNLVKVLGKDGVSQEARGSHGRSDLIIHSHAMVPEHGPCVLEFKVLRHGNSDDACEKWLSEGLEQVIDYGSDRAAKSHYLMVYDGRKRLGELDLIREESRERGVTYLHFEMYNTPSGERKTKVKK